jgi:hypothetical protein
MSFDIILIMRDINGRINQYGASTRVDRSSKIEYSWHNPFTTEFATVVGHLWHKRLYFL